MAGTANADSSINLGKSLVFIEYMECVLVFVEQYGRKRCFIYWSVVTYVRRVAGVCDGPNGRVRWRRGSHDLVCRRVSSVVSQDDPT